MPAFRLPGEWERQCATMLAWPSASGDWADRLEAIRAEYQSLINAIAAHQPVIVLLQPGDEADFRLQWPASTDCRPTTQPRHSINPVAIPHNDTWCRDYGPISLIGSGKTARALDFRFNGWGGKYPAEQDNQVSKSLLDRDFLDDLFAGFNRTPVDFELEGGAIESNGAGQLLINWHCLRQRHPNLSENQIAETLRSELSITEIIGIDMPPLPGDDTDGHIDTLARFIRPDAIVYQLDQNPDRNRRLLEQLSALRQSGGDGYQLIALPPVENFSPQLPANYVNFLFINGACLMPTYGVASDREALRILAAALPDRKIIPVAAQTMITHFGGPHCATMHIPELDCGVQKNL